MSRLGVLACHVFAMPLSFALQLLSTLRKLSAMLKSALADEQNVHVKDFSDTVGVLAKAVAAAKVLKSEAVLSFALKCKVKETARKLVRMETIQVASGEINRADVQPALLKAAEELLG